MINSASEFVDLRMSDDLDEQQRATHEQAPEQVWLDIIERHPDMRSWVAHNKTVPISILRTLAQDRDPRVRWTVAQKRKLDAAMLAQLATDEDESVRLSVAHNRSTPHETLEQLTNDPWAEIVRVARERLGLDT